MHLYVLYLKMSAIREILICGQIENSSFINNRFIVAYIMAMANRAFTNKRKYNVLTMKKVIGNSSMLD